MAFAAFLIPFLVSAAASPPGSRLELAPAIAALLVVLVGAGTNALLAIVRLVGQQRLLALAYALGAMLWLLTFWWGQPTVR